MGGLRVVFSSRRAFGRNRSGEEIRKEIVPALGEHGLGMELHALNPMSAMAQAHDLALRTESAHLELRRNLVGSGDERVIARHAEWIGQTVEHATAIMADEGGLAVHGPAGPHHQPAIDLRDALMAEADAEDGNACA